MYTVNQTGNFETLKILEKGRSTYIGMDYVEGELLIYKVLSAQKISKKSFYEWFISLCITLHGYHKSRCTTFNLISPYTLLVDNENRVHLLDLKAPSNENIREVIENSITRNNFTYLGVKNYQNKYFADYYSFAKTIQFVLSQANIQPNLSKKEIKLINKMLVKCMNTSKKSIFISMKEIQEHLESIGHVIIKTSRTRNRVACMLLSSFY